MVTLARTALVCVMCFSTGLSQVLIAQGNPVVWQVPGEVTPGDRKAILQIARAVGIHEPGTVSVPIRSPCLLVEVESRPVLLANRVLSTILGIRQKRGAECRSFGADRPLKQLGNWVAFLSPTNPRQRERWRIHDGDWHVDVYLSGDIPYSDAVTIVQAIRRKQLVDRRPLSQSSSAIRYIDASRILSIRGSVPPGTIPGQYEVTEGEGAGKSGGGDWLTVRIRGGHVELHNHGQWIS
jgi:hypothetical protein